MFLGNDTSSEVLIVMVHLGRFLVHLGQLLLNHHVLRDGSFSRVCHRATRQLAKLLSRLMNTLDHLLLHSSTSCY